jgi:hypothetical protein
VRDERKGSLMRGHEENDIGNKKEKLNEIIIIPFIIDVK